MALKPIVHFDLKEGRFSLLFLQASKSNLCGRRVDLIKQLPDDAELKQIMGEFGQAQSLTNCHRSRKN
jgi:hypothetical protein